ncbi:MAG: hypothetical protein IJ838_02720 [Paludibacteraceae bacterium]|nr:hypothetical protein [Paludibacteraceae bacterium]
MKKLFLLLTAIVLCSSMSFARLSGDQDNSSLKGNLSHIYDLKMDKSNLLKSKVNDSTVSIKRRDGHQWLMIIVSRDLIIVLIILYGMMLQSHPLLRE